MNSELAHILSITTKCSAGCSHCPFADPEMERLDLPLNAILRILRESNKPLTVISGGEPFEYPFITEILSMSIQYSSSFRIATGGFIDLSPWIEALQSLYHSTNFFQGISMGTDILSARVNHDRWVPIWRKNINLLAQVRIPYSLTFTVGCDNMSANDFNIWDWKEHFESLPAFIYLRYSEEEKKQNMIHKIKNVFSDVPILEDHV